MPEEKHIHHISFDIPVPVNYGGAIDVFYKLRSFKEEGVKVHFHCFQYDREPTAELEELCESVHYYKRSDNKSLLLTRDPYIVVSRSSEDLRQALLKDDYPILFEGLHSCMYLNDPALIDRQKVVRTHNIEHHYYRSLAKAEKNILKSMYFKQEAGKLEQFESVLTKADAIAAISRNDHIHFSQTCSNVETISAFHPNEKVSIQLGSGEYALYHGSLDVAENNEAALYLVKNVFVEDEIPLVIAGNKISKELLQAIDKNPYVSWAGQMNTEKIYNLISNAHVNILPTFQATGIKLKLLAALYTGRHCLVNMPMVTNTGLESLCEIEDSPERMRMALKELFQKPFSAEEIEKRKKVLDSNGFSNQINIRKLIRLLFS